MTILKSCDILIACAPGGHLTVAKELFEFSNLTTFYVITSLSKRGVGACDDVYLIPESNRDWRIIIQFIYALYLIYKINPRVIVSTGAGVAVPFLIVGKFLFKKVVFIESASRTQSLSLAGKLLYCVTDRFYVRSRVLKEKYSRAIYLS